MLISQKFLKDIPEYCKVKMVSKLGQFEKELKAVNDRTKELPMGYWVRKIKNTNIFKFRLNNKDRILYSMIPDRLTGKNEVLFLRYVQHDEQIRVGKNINISNESIIEIDQTIYHEEDEDSEKVEKIVQEEAYQQLNLNDIPCIVASEEDLVVLADQNNDDYMYYLSDEQYNVLESLGKSTILLTGGGGTGKTVVLVNILDTISKNNKAALYLSYNPLLTENIESLCDKYCRREKNVGKVEIKTIAQLCENIIKEEKKELVSNYYILKWLNDKQLQGAKGKYIDAYELLTEIRGIIKGYLGLEYTHTLMFDQQKYFMITKEQYLKIPKQYSNHDPEKKAFIYDTAVKYQEWLNSNNFIDDNDLAYMIITKYHNRLEKWDWIVADEVQDLSEMQLYMISCLANEKKHIVWTGDLNQTIHPTFFNFIRLKNLYYTLNIKTQSMVLHKNYRSTYPIVELINKISKSRKQYISASKYDYDECAVRNGSRPYLINNERGCFDEIVKQVKGKHYCAIIVPNETEKEKMLEKYEGVAGRVFCVHEIKGLEYDRVFCYNILSAYRIIWDEILNGIYANNEKMKYYFNLLYVAVSRAKEGVYIYEDCLDDLKLDILQEYEVIAEFNEHIFGLEKISSLDEWKKEADRLEKIGQLDKVDFARNCSKEEQIQIGNEDSDKYFSNIFKDIDTQVPIEENIDELLKSSIIEYRKRNYGEAIRQLDELLKKHPEEAKIYYYLGNSYGYMAGGMDYAIGFFAKALQLDEDYYECYLDMAAVLNANGRCRDAINILDCAIKKFPNMSNAYQVKSAVYFKMGDMYAAMKVAEKGRNYKGYTFDTYNHCWIKPKGTVKSQKSKPVNNSIDKKEQSIPGELTYLIAGAELELKQCKEGINFSKVEISKNGKDCFITFNKEICMICDNYSNCGASKAKNNGVLRVKKSSLKQVISMNKKKLKAPTIREPIITKQAEQDNELRCLLNEFIEEWENIAKRDVEMHSAEMQRLEKLFGHTWN